MWPVLYAAHGLLQFHAFRMALETEQFVIHSLEFAFFGPKMQSRGASGQLKRSIELWNDEPHFGACRNQRLAIGMWS